jgi:anti-sigma factor RsiW
MDDLDLHAFIDGELSPERAAEVEAAIAGNPVLAARVRDFRADKHAVAAAYRPLIDAPVPIALLADAQARSSRSATSWRRNYLAIAGAALAASFVLALALHAPRDHSIEQALAARERSSTPSRELSEHDQTIVQATNQAMSEMLGNRVRVPDLQSAGFKFISAQIYGRARYEAVQLRYEDATRRLFTVFLRPPAGPDAFEVTQRGTVRICVWQNADETAVMAGEMSTPELFRLASLTYSSLGL